MFALAATTGRAAAFVAPRVGARAFSGSAMDMANPKVFVSFVLALLACLPAFLPVTKPPTEGTNCMYTCSWYLD